MCLNKPRNLATDTGTSMYSYPWNLGSFSENAKFSHKWRLADSDDPRDPNF